MDVAVSCHTRCSLSDNNEQLSSHCQKYFSRRKIFDANYRPRSDFTRDRCGVVVSPWGRAGDCWHRGGRWGCVPRTRPRTSGGPVRRTRGGGAGHLSPVTPSRCHAVTIVTGDPCSHNITYYANCPLQVSTSSSLGVLNWRTFSTFCCLRRISKMSWTDLWMWYWDKKYAKFGVFLNTNCFILKRNWLCGFHDFW